MNKISEDFQMKVCVGGTFDLLHKGHKELINKAFEIGTEVFIGLSSDEMASGSRSLKVNSYEKRKNHLDDYIKKRGFRTKYIIVNLNDSFGSSVKNDFDAIIVSPETKSGAQDINKIREKKGLKSLEIITIPYIYAQDCCPISSTKIKNGEIDFNGKMLREIMINVGSKNILKIEAIKEFYSKFFNNVCINGFENESKVSAWPVNNEIINGAINRAEISIRKADFGIGIEAGIYSNNITKKYSCLHYCAIIDKFGKITVGHSSGFEMPDEIISRIKNGESFDDVLSSIFVGEKGMIFKFSKGLIERKDLIKQAIQMAFIPRLKMCF